ncbi:MAG: RsiV family protein [Minisyncoccia bacterium]
MQRKTSIVVAVVVAALIGIIAYAALRPAPAKAPGAEAPTAPPVSFKEVTKYYDIGTNYPSSTPLLASVGTSADIAAVARMKKFVDDTVAQFKTDGNFDNLTPKDIQMLGFDQGRKEKLNIVYLIASSPRTVSYIFTTYEDTLGAHGNTFFHTFTFDTSTGAPLALVDLFTPGSDYLGALSSISRAKLPSVIGSSADMTFITPGTTPEAKNFQNFFFDDQRLVILFAPYAVAPYSSGPQTLPIPVNELSNILKSEYR